MVTFIDRYGNEKRFNLIGFNFGPKRYKWQTEGFDYPEPTPPKTCIIHPGVVVVPIKGKEGLYCSQCGFQYREEDTASDELFNPKEGPNKKPRIITGRRKKKYYDKQGNLITDPTLLQDIARGATVYSYKEEKVEK